jgi:glycosyltransferase involved in cell wall biosynthesis
MKTLCTKSSNSFHDIYKNHSMLLIEILKQEKRISKNIVKETSRNMNAQLDENLILFVGMHDSPHFQKWLMFYIAEFPEMKVAIFPSDRPRRGNLSIYEKGEKRNEIDAFNFSKNRLLNFILFLTLDKLFGIRWRAYFLAKFILGRMPATIHFHETQHAAYIYNLISSYEDLPGNTKRILSTWGSDLILYSQFELHRERLKSTLSWVNILTAERAEDLEIARALDFEGRFESPIFITVGSDLEIITHIDPSVRKLVLIKGYQDLPGRALSALEAISQLEKEKFEFSFVVYSASKVVRKRAKKLKQELGVDIKCIKRVPREEMDRLFSKARVAISLAISDGLPGSLVEAMKTGAFPIQSRNSVGLDFIEDGVNGFLVDPDDINSITNSLKRALSDDILVDSAYPKNLNVLEKKYSLEVGRQKLRNLYVNVD